MRESADVGIVLVSTSALHCSKITMAKNGDPIASGNYPLEPREGEEERLRIQAEAMRFDAAIMLDRVGVSEGWRCLDLGCGASGITDLLSDRAGASGSVVGLDSDRTLLKAARAWAETKGMANTEFVEGNAYATKLPDESFDFVHIRFLLGTAGQPVRLLREARRLTRPGGVLAIGEPDAGMLNCYPLHPAWNRLKKLLIDGFSAAGADLTLGSRAYSLMLAQGLDDVVYRPFIVGVRNFDPMVDYLPQTIESIRNTLLKQGLTNSKELDELIAECRNHLADPNTVFTTYLVAQVWGRKREESKV